MAEELVEDPVYGTRYRFHRTTDDDGTEVQHVEMWIQPGGGVSAHKHPVMEERFTVLDGTAELLSGRRWEAAGPGRTVVVAPGTRHAFRNRGTAVAHLRCEARPASSLQSFLEDVAGLSRAGKLHRVGLPKPNGLLEAAVLVEDYKDMVVLGAPAPPPPLQRLIFGPLARIAHRRGMRAGRFSALA